MSTQSLLIQLYEDQVKFLQGQIKVLKEHVSSHPEETILAKKGDGKSKKKRALSAYQVFMRERLKSSGGDPKASLSMVSKVWNGLDNASKEKYANMAKIYNDEKSNEAETAETAPKAAKATKKRKLPSSEESAAVSAPVAAPPAAAPAAAAPAAAPAASSNKQVPPTPAASVPETPATSNEHGKSDKKKKKKHHKEKTKNDS